MSAPVRIASVDILRGLVMVIMALDHVREFWSPTAASPEDLSQGDAALFLTRWITHLCAPAFMFLSGIGICRYMEKAGKTKAAAFCLTRGFWLIFIEVVVMSFILTHGYDLIVLSVLWAIGWSMVLMSAFIWLPRVAIATIAVGMIGAHNLWSSISPETFPEYVAAIIHNTPFFIQPLGTLVTYSIVPWVGVMMAGFVAGSWFNEPSTERNERLMKSAFVLLGLFVLVRTINEYGDPNPWSIQANGGMFTALSFVNVTKYPPSLMFLLLTTGITMLILSAIRREDSRINQIFLVYGRVPFFFYILHFGLVSLASWLWTLIQFGEGINIAFTPAAARPSAYEPGLLRVYIVWMIILLITYYPCLWFGGYKRRNTSWWLGYL